MTHDPKWEARNWFDELKSFDGLRKMQHISGPLRVQQYAELFTTHRQRLLKCVSLIAMACGGGKSMTVVAMLLAINREVNLRVTNAPRARRVLWFVDQRPLAISLFKELSEEPVKFGLHHRKPTIQICDQTGDLDRGPGHNDITISCPHTLWEKENQTRSDQEIETVLSQYDVMIFDECDWAKEQMKRLVRLAPHSIKIGISASAIDAVGEILRNFVLASVASYQKIYELDKCLKPMLAWEEARRAGYIKGVSHGAYGRLHGLNETRFTGRHGEKFSNPGMMATIHAAIEDSRALEIEMKAEWRDVWFSPHIFVRANSIKEAQLLCDQTNELLRALGYGVDDGWTADVVHDDDESRIKKPLFKKGGAEHKFFHAKTNNGRCDRGSTRILFVVDTGIRGINHWGIQFIVDLRRSNSVSSQTQLKGRGSRLPSHLAALSSHEKFAHFLHERYYFPIADEKEDVGAMQSAYEFILEMDQRFEAAGLPEWEDLLHEDVEDFKGEPQGVAHPFSLEDRIAVDDVLGSRFIEGKQPPTDGEIDAIIDTLPGTMTDVRKERAKDHINKVLTDPVYRKSVVDVDNFKQIRPISSEEPKSPNEYTIEELQEFVRSSDIYPRDFEKALVDATVRMAVAINKHERDKRFFHPQPTLWRLHDEGDRKGVLDSIANAALAQLKKRNLADFKDIGKIRMAINQAAALITGVADQVKPTRNDGPLDHPAYHYAFTISSNQKAIKNLAYAIMVQRGQLGHAGAVYADMINGISDVAE